jgi:hypothetical protein
MVSADCGYYHLRVSYYLAVIKSLSDPNSKTQTGRKEPHAQFGAKHLNRPCIQDFRNLQEAEKDGEV